MEHSIKHRMYYVLEPYTLKWLESKNYTCNGSDRSFKRHLQNVLGKNWLEQLHDEISKRFSTDEVKPIHISHYVQEVDLMFRFPFLFVESN